MTRRGRPFDCASQPGKAWPVAPLRVLLCRPQREMRPSARQHLTTGPEKLKIRVVVHYRQKCGDPIVVQGYPHAGLRILLCKLRKAVRGDALDEPGRSPNGLPALLNAQRTQGDLRFCCHLSRWRQQSHGGEQQFQRLRLLRRRPLRKLRQPLTSPPHPGRRIARAHNKGALLSAPLLCQASEPLHRPRTHSFPPTNTS